MFSSLYFCLFLLALFLSKNICFMILNIFDCWTNQTMLKLTDCNLHHHLVLLTLGNCLCVCSRPQIHQPCFFVRSIQTSDGQLFEHDHQSDYFLNAGFESATFSQHRLGLFGRPLGPVVDLVRVSFYFCRHVATLNNEGTFSSSQNSRSARALLGPFSFHPSDGSP